MPFGIDIIRIANKFQKECSYEPELHPGATFKLSDLKTTLKLFTTGSVTLTAPSVSVAQQAVNRMYPILYEYRRNAPPNTSINNIKNEQILNIKNEQSHYSQLQPQQQQQQQQYNTSNSLPFMNSQTSSTTRMNSSENGSSSSDSTSSISSSSSSSSSLLTNNHSVFNAPNSNQNQHHTYFNNDISLTPHLLYEAFSSSSSNSNLPSQSHLNNINSNNTSNNNHFQASSLYNLNSPNGFSSATNSSSSSSSISAHNWYSNLGSNAGYGGDQGLISIDHVDDFLP